MLTSTSGGDTLEGDSGADTLTGGGGNDTIKPGSGSDTYSDSGGDDRLDYGDNAGGVSLSIDGVNDGEPGAGESVPAGFERILGGSGPDHITGDGAVNFLIGRAGDDVLDGAGGNDILDPDTPTLADGCDTLRGGAGDDFLQDVNGGPGCRDLVDYSDHAGPVHVTLGGGLTTGNGQGAENDSIATFFADVLGTGAGDTINASTDTHPHTLFGGGASTR